MAPLGWMHVRWRDKKGYLLEKAKCDGRESESEGSEHYEEMWDWLPSRAMTGSMFLLQVHPVARVTINSQADVHALGCH